MNGVQEMWEQAQREIDELRGQLGPLVRLYAHLTQVLLVRKQMTDEHGATQEMLSTLQIRTKVQGYPELMSRLLDVSDIHPKILEVEVDEIMDRVDELKEMQRKCNIEIQRKLEYIEKG